MGLVDTIIAVIGVFGGIAGFILGISWERLKSRVDAYARFAGSVRALYDSAKRLPANQRQDLNQDLQKQYAEVWVWGSDRVVKAAKRLFENIIGGKEGQVDDNARELLFLMRVEAHQCPRRTRVKKEDFKLIGPGEQRTDKTPSLSGPGCE